MKKPSRVKLIRTLLDLYDQGYIKLNEQSYYSTDYILEFSKFKLKRTYSSSESKIYLLFNDFKLYPVFTIEYFFDSPRVVFRCSFRRCGVIKWFDGVSKDLGISHEEFAAEINSKIIELI